MPHLQTQSRVRNDHSCRSLLYQLWLSAFESGLIFSTKCISTPPRNTVVNYEDPNFNISLPVFIIHGNHDDPAGSEDLSALDVLAASNLLNYYGKTVSGLLLP